MPHDLFEPGYAIFCNNRKYTYNRRDEYGEFEFITMNEYGSIYDTTFKFWEVQQGRIAYLEKMLKEGVYVAYNHDRPCMQVSDGMSYDYETVLLQFNLKTNEWEKIKDE